MLFDGLFSRMFFISPRNEGIPSRIRVRAVRRNGLEQYDRVKRAGGFPGTDTHPESGFQVGMNIRRIYAFIYLISWSGWFPERFSRGINWGCEGGKLRKWGWNCGKAFVCWWATRSENFGQGNRMRKVVKKKRRRKFMRCVPSYMGVMLVLVFVCKFVWVSGWGGRMWIICCLCWKDLLCLGKVSFPFTLAGCGKYVSGIFVGTSIVCLCRLETLDVVLFNISRTVDDLWVIVCWR